MSTWNAQRVRRSARINTAKKDRVDYATSRGDESEWSSTEEDIISRKKKAQSISEESSEWSATGSDSSNDSKIIETKYISYKKKTVRKSTGGRSRDEESKQTAATEYRRSSRLKKVKRRLFVHSDDLSSASGVEEDSGEESDIIDINDVGKKKELRCNERRGQPWSLSCMKDALTEETLLAKHVEWVSPDGSLKICYNIQTLISCGKNFVLRQPPHFRTPISNEFRSKVLVHFRREVESFEKNIEEETPESNNSETDREMNHSDNSYRVDMEYVQFGLARFLRHNDAYFHKWTGEAMGSGDLVCCPICYEHEKYRESSGDSNPLSQSLKNRLAMENNQIEDPLEVLSQNTTAITSRALTPRICDMKNHLIHAHGIKKELLTREAGCAELLKKYKIRAPDGIVQRYLSTIPGNSIQEYWRKDGSFRRLQYNMLRDEVALRGRVNPNDELDVTQLESSGNRSDLDDELDVTHQESNVEYSRFTVWEGENFQDELEIGNELFEYLLDPYSQKVTVDDDDFLAGSSETSESEMENTTGSNFPKEDHDDEYKLDFTPKKIYCRVTPPDSDASAMSDDSIHNNPVFEPGTKLKVDYDDGKKRKWYSATTIRFDIDKQSLVVIYDNDNSEESIPRDFVAARVKIDKYFRGNSRSRRKVSDDEDFQVESGNKRLHPRKLEFGEKQMTPNSKRARYRIPSSSSEEDGNKLM